MRREVILNANATAPTRARDILSTAIPPPELAGRFSDARLAISELVTNAVLHGGLRSYEPVRLVIDTDDDRVRVEVEQKTPATDAGVVWPRLSGDGRVGGFGLSIVQATADDWGVEPGPPGRVWFEFRR